MLLLFFAFKILGTIWEITSGVHSTVCAFIAYILYLSELDIFNPFKDIAILSIA